MMSMKSEGKPVCFVEDCAVRLADLADFTDRLTELFHRHGTTGTWYAHASVGLLHVRPVLNLRHEADVKALRAIAEEAFDIVAEYRAATPASMATASSARSFTRGCSGAAWSRASRR